MKKFCYVFALLTMVAFTSCLNDTDDDMNTQTLTGTVNNRAVYDEQVVFSQVPIQIVINNADMTMQMSSSYRDADGVSHAINTDVMNLTARTNSLFQFTSPTLSGLINITTGMMRYVMEIDGDQHVTSTTDFELRDLVTTITDEDGNTYNHTNSIYYFVLDANGKNASMCITNFISNVNGSIQAAALDYKNLNLTPTTNGYLITADVATCLQSESFNLKNLAVTFTDDCMTVNGSFKVQGSSNSYTMSGSVFSGI